MNGRAYHGIVVLALAGLIQSACDVAEVSLNSEVMVETDSVYLLQTAGGGAEATVGFVLRNEGDEEVYIEPNCLAEIRRMVEKWNGAEWQSSTPFTPAFFADCGPGDRLALEPGEPYYGELRLSADDVPPDSPTLEGTYRLRVDGLFRVAERATGPALPTTVSSGFEIRW